MEIIQQRDEIFFHVFDVEIWIERMVLYSSLGEVLHATRNVNFGRGFDKHWEAGGGGQWKAFLEWKWIAFELGGNGCVYWRHWRRRVRLVLLQVYQIIDTMRWRRLGLGRVLGVRMDQNIKSNAKRNRKINENKENIKINSTKAELKENQLKSCSNHARGWVRVGRTFQYFLLPLDAGFPSSLRLGLLLVNVCELRFHTHLPERLRLWVTSGGRVDLQLSRIRIDRGVACPSLTLCWVIGVFDWTVAPKVRSSCSSSTNFCLSIDLSSDSIVDARFLSLGTKAR